MGDSDSKAGQGKEPEIAAAEWLLEDAPPAEIARPASPVIAPTGGEGFELEQTAAEGLKPPIPARAERRSVVEPPRPRAKMAMPTAPAVDQVWSRTSEWGASLAMLVAWAIAIFWLVYLCLNSEAYSFAAMLFAIGCVGGLLLCYPILITLERPVRITPEQAARDYFGSLSHHFPHYRRMWLLLSARGRASPEFASHEGFKRYWKRQLATLKEGHAGRFAPLVFHVEDFRAEKSAGRQDIEASFQLRILVRGHRDQGAIWSLPLERTFARGPDNMWYLDDGTISLVRGAGSAKPTS